MLEKFRRIYSHIAIILLICILILFIWVEIDNYCKDRAWNDELHTLSTYETWTHTNSNTKSDINKLIDKKIPYDEFDNRNCEIYENELKSKYIAVYPKHIITLSKNNKGNIQIDWDNMSF